MPDHHRITGNIPREVSARQITQFPQTEVRIIRAQLDLALCLVLELMDEPRAKLTASNRLKLAALAMQLRDAMALLANRALLDPPPQLPPRLLINIDLAAFLALCAQDARLPAMVRQAATELKEIGRDNVRDEAKRVIDLAGYVAAHRDIAGTSVREAAKEAAQSDEFRGIGMTRIVVAVALHNLATKLVGKGGAK